MPIGGSCFEIGGRDIASGGATSASVVEDQPSELRELAQERAPVGFVPYEVDVPREGMEVHGEIDWPRPDHLIGDIGAVRSLCVTGLIRHDYTDSVHWLDQESTRGRYEEAEDSIYARA